MSRFFDSLAVVVLFAVFLALPFTQAFPRSDGKSDPIESRSSPKAVLDYGTFVGGYNATYDISYFKSIPFAAPPVGELRYRAPQPPLRYKDDFDATVTKDFCVQRTVNGSEDCLYLEIYGRPFVKGAKKPVVVWLYGGGYIQGGGSISWPPFVFPTLNVSSENDFIVVLPNYRVNSFGFLAGDLVKEDPTTDLNVGLLDQRAALQWVQKYIHIFGGDPSKVTLWGQSAGAGSVLFQTIAKSSQPLFRSAVASSPFVQKQYHYNAPQIEQVLTTFLNYTNCSAIRSQAIGCLRKVPLQTLRDASLAVDTIHGETLSHAWTPVIDGELITERFSVAAAAKRINNKYALMVYNTHEGENFVPSAVSNWGEWMKEYLPGFSDSQFEALEKLYLDEEGASLRAASVYRDSVLACPALWAASAAGKGWLVEFGVGTAKHASDTQFWNTIQPAQQQYPHIYQAYAGGYASFAQTADPNRNSLTPVVYPGVGTGKLFLLGDGSRAVANSSTPIGTRNFAELKEKCDFWRANGASVPL
ncbi:uncharacterized protein LAJ45_05070 [Morchella importuna]|uniref:Carboxylic ester hydrolase n=1 Tax=Morchella conica CCBAS932 TaxID=1392247 RepID=A0A3N4L7X6_9PEZI|nr:uncharacterized protein LAJ45_05070 [Morchella importuna]KAH8150888.1 hypothetical protein LAJ45_05070 [Morchella importuna]RPB14105.1 putative carboxylesterase [Morchella conica CCBAS932]